MPIYGFLPCWHARANEKMYKELITLPIDEAFELRWNRVLCLFIASKVRKEYSHLKVEIGRS
jgi:hypothetical protein